MPDIDFQKIELNLIPKKGDEPVIFYASQYETARPFIADLKWGTTEYAPGDDCHAEIDIRKNDNNLVVITDDVAIDNNEVSVVLPVQALTCIGKNLGQVKIYSADDHLIAALNFLLEVQPDPLAGGVDSETAIDNLTTQIESIAEEVIGENYYDKTEVDNLLADKADVSDLPDMTQYYTKTQTDTLLNGKADASTTYTKTEVDNALALKANISDLATVATTGDYDDLINKPVIPAAQIQSDYTQADTTAVDYIKNKPDIAGMIAAAIFDILPVGTASGSPCSFDTAIAAPLQALTAEITASGGNGTPSTPIPIVGISSLDITRCGVNLYPIKISNDTFSDNAGATHESSGDELVINSTSSGNSGVYSTNASDIGKLLGMLSGEVTYSFDIYVTVAGWYLIGITNVGREAKNLSTGWQRITLTGTSNRTINTLVFYNQTNTASEIRVKNFIIESGSSASDYEPYNGQTFTVSFGQTVYGGVYDANRGKVRITHKYQRGGFSRISVDSSNKLWLCGDLVDSKIYESTETPNAVSNMFVGKSLQNCRADNSGFCIFPRGLYIAGYVGNESALDALLPNLEIAYELATPIEIDVSELSVAAIVGTNNITSDGGGDVTVSYKDSIQHYIDNQ